jgi:hypothetical protein
LEKLRSIFLSSTAPDTSEIPAITELYQLSTLIYLTRISSTLLPLSPRAHQQITRAFTIFSTLASCDRQFPLLILGCEARTDEQRSVILDLIERTEKGNSRPFIQVKILIFAMWAQDDLADQEMDYWDKMSGIVSACSIMPSLV